MRKNRNINLDLLKVLACVGVVLLHTTMGGFKETGSWNLLAYLYYLGTYSIPLFFYDQWLFVVRQEGDNLSLHTPESKMDFNNSVIMVIYRMAF
ncbi:repeating unit O-acetyltransferase WefK [Streptococcus pneumoniae]|nr:repeating unit O-acetyltransferase WefK [Streptococcus pneumoniae]